MNEHSQIMQCSVVVVYQDGAVFIADVAAERAQAYAKDVAGWAGVASIYVTSPEPVGSVTRRADKPVYTRLKRG